ncbi:MAG: HyaD/HybD family hydrogenase maturation endopeptidase [Pseudomonadota bacterium]
MKINTIAIIGLGNILLRDEGVGVRVIEQLKKNYSFSPSINIIDGGTLGFALINEIQDCEKLIIVDAVKAGEKPGTIYKFSREDIELKIPVAVSVHDVGFLEVLNQWKMLGVCPAVVFFGIEPYDISSFDMSLSSLMQEKIPKLVGLILEELKNDGIAAKIV